MIAAILLDLPLQQMDGCAVRPALCQLSAPRETPINAVTGSAIAAGREDIYAMEETRLLLPSAS
jgi:hypothetical protein